MIIARNKEAYRHYVLSDMVDLIAEDGYADVMSDLEAMLAIRINKMTSSLNVDGVPVEFEERN
jgi:hypothetical protein